VVPRAKTIPLASTPHTIHPRARMTGREA